jgi:hypothetical protein
MNSPTQLETRPVVDAGKEAKTEQAEPQARPVAGAIQAATTQPPAVNVFWLPAEDTTPGVNPAKEEKQKKAEKLEERKADKDAKEKDVKDVKER